MPRISEQTTELLQKQNVIETKLQNLVDAVTSGGSSSNVSTELDSIKRQLEEIKTVQDAILAKANAIGDIL